MAPYILLFISFMLSFIGGAIGASMNDKTMMIVGMLPGIFGIIGLMFIYGKE